jgi:hypothetical protein
MDVNQIATLVLMGGLAAQQPATRNAMLVYVRCGLVAQQSAASVQQIAMLMLMSGNALQPLG